MAGVEITPLMSELVMGTGHFGKIAGSRWEKAYSSDDPSSLGFFHVVTKTKPRTTGKNYEMTPLPIRHYYSSSLASVICF